MSKDYLDDRNIDDRDGAQPSPKPNASTPIVDLVLRDVTDEQVKAELRHRAEVGLARYGVKLQAHNGRDALRDAMDEALDLPMYLRQAVEEETDALDKLELIEMYAIAMRFTVRLRQFIERRARDALLDAASDAGALHEDLP